MTAQLTEWNERKLLPEFTPHFLKLRRKYGRKCGVQFAHVTYVHFVP